METNKIKKGQRVIARDSHGRLSPGEYTGFSPITRMYHVSFYNGDVGKFKNIEELTVDIKTSNL